MKAVSKVIGPGMGILTAVALELQAGSACWAQSTTPFIPASWGVGITPQTSGKGVSVIVHVTLPAPRPCFYITNWGAPRLVGHSVTVDAQFWASSLVPCPTVLSGVTNRYDLGPLPPGDYGFAFAAWGVTVKTQAFRVPVRVSILAAQSASQVQLCWNTATNAWYRLEYCRTLATNEWVPLTGWLLGNGSLFCTNDAVLGGQAQRFYRVAGTNGAPF
jgi:hypothetical protein